MPTHLVHDLRGHPAGCAHKGHPGSFLGLLVRCKVSVIQPVTHSEICPRVNHLLPCTSTVIHECTFTLYFAYTYLLMIYTYKCIPTTLWWSCILTILFLSLPGSKVTHITLTRQLYRPVFTNQNIPSLHISAEFREQQLKSFQSPPTLEMTYLCIWVLPWRYSNPCSTSFNTVAMTTSSKTPPLGFLARTCFTISNREPEQCAHSSMYSSINPSDTAHTCKVLIEQCTVCTSLTLTLPTIYVTLQCIYVHCTINIHVHNNITVGIQIFNAWVWMPTFCEGVQCSQQSNT